MHAVNNDQEQDIAERWKEKGGSEGQKEGFWENEAWAGTKAREEKKRGGTPWTATAFRHVTFLFTSGCNTHDSHYWLSLTPFHRHIRAEVLWPPYAQARMLTQSHKHAPLTDSFVFPASLFEKSFSHLLFLLSHQASFQQSCSGGTVGWLKVFKAAPLPWWVSTVACSHALPGKPDPNI